MRFDELFEQRSLVASKLKHCIRDLGYTDFFEYLLQSDKAIRKIKEMLS